MIDSKVFDELRNRGIITQVGISSEDYTDLADLHDNGIVTMVGVEKEYDEIVSEFSDDVIEEEIEEKTTEVKDIVVDDDTE